MSSGGGPAWLAKEYDILKSKLRMASRERQEAETGKAVLVLSGAVRAGVRRAVMASFLSMRCAAAQPPVAVSVPRTAGTLVIRVGVSRWACRASLLAFSHWLCSCLSLQLASDALAFQSTLSDSLSEHQIEKATLAKELDIAKAALRKNASVKEEMITLRARVEYLSKHSPPSGNLNSASTAGSSARNRAVGLAVSTGLSGDENFENIAKSPTGEVSLVERQFMQRQKVMKRELRQVSTQLSEAKHSAVSYKCQLQESQVKCAALEDELNAYKANGLELERAQHTIQALTSSVAFSQQELDYVKDQHKQRHAEMAGVEKSKDAALLKQADQAAECDTLQNCIHNLRAVEVQSSKAHAVLLKQFSARCLTRFLTHFTVQSQLRSCMRTWSEKCWAVSLRDEQHRSQEQKLEIQSLELKIDDQLNKDLAKSIEINNCREVTEANNLHMHVTCLYSALSTSMSNLSACCSSLRVAMTLWHRFVIWSRLLVTEVGQQSNAVAVRQYKHAMSQIANTKICGPIVLFLRHSSQRALRMGIACFVNLHHLMTVASTECHMNEFKNRFAAWSSTHQNFVEAAIASRQLNASLKRISQKHLRVALSRLSGCSQMPWTDANATVHAQLIGLFASNCCRRHLHDSMGHLLNVMNQALWRLQRNAFVQDVRRLTDSLSEHQHVCEEWRKKARASKDEIAALRQGCDASSAQVKVLNVHLQTTREKAKQASQQHDAQYLELEFQQRKAAMRKELKDFKNTISKRDAEIEKQNIALLEAEIERKASQETQEKLLTLHKQNNALHSHASRLELRCAHLDRSQAAFLLSRHVWRVQSMHLYSLFAALKAWVAVSFEDRDEFVLRKTVAVLRTELQQRDRLTISLESDLRMARNEEEELTDRVQMLQRHQSQSASVMTRRLAYRALSLLVLRSNYTTTCVTQAVLHAWMYHIKIMQTSQAFLRSAQEQQIQEAEFSASDRAYLRTELQRSCADLKVLRRDKDALHVNVCHTARLIAFSRLFASSRMCWRTAASHCMWLFRCRSATTELYHLRLHVEHLEKSTRADQSMQAGTAADQAKALGRARREMEEERRKNRQLQDEIHILSSFKHESAYVKAEKQFFERQKNLKADLRETKMQLGILQDSSEQSEQAKVQLLEQRLDVELELQQYAQDVEHYRAEKALYVAQCKACLVLLLFRSRMAMLRTSRGIRMCMKRLMAFQPIQKRVSSRGSIAPRTRGAVTPRKPTPARGVRPVNPAPMYR